MRIVTQTLLIISFAIVAAGFALAAPDILEVDAATAYLLGLGLFIALLTIFILASQSLSRDDLEDRFANVRYDLVQISETVNKLMGDVDRLSNRTFLASYKQFWLNLHYLTPILRLRL